MMTGTWQKAWVNEIRLAVAACALISILLIPSCHKEGAQVFNLATISAGGVDLKTTAPENVPVSAVIFATFTTDLDPGSVVAGGIVITRDYDSANIGLTLILSRNVLTIRSTKDLIPGAHYTLTISPVLRSKQGMAFASFSAKFKTAGTFVPPGMVSYWNFEQSADDVVGTLDPGDVNVTLKVPNSYLPGRNVLSGTAGYFNGKTDIVQIPNGSTILGAEFTITLWMKLESTGHVDAGGNQKGSFVFGIGNRHGLQLDVAPNYEWVRVSHGFLTTDAKTGTSDFQFYANGRLYNNLSGQPDSIRRGVDNATTVNQNFGAGGIKSRLDNTWAQVAFSFDDSTKTRSLYINGELMYRQKLTLMDTTFILPQLIPLTKAFRLAFVPDTDIPPTWDNYLAFGFWQSKTSYFGGSNEVYTNPDANHFQGLLDDIRIFSRALSDLEISYIYQDEKP